MTRGRVLTLATAALLLEVLPLVAAHGDEHNGGPMDMSKPDAPRPQVQDDAQPQSYWSLSEHAALMYWHVTLEVIAWIIILPVGGLPMLLVP